MKEKGRKKVSKREGEKDERKRKKQSKGGGKG